MTALKTRTKCRDPSSVQKDTGPPTLPSHLRWRGRAGGRRMPSRDGGPTASILVLRAEEPRPRIADHVAPLIVERAARPIAARTPDRISPTVGGIGDVAWRHRIGRIRRVRNRSADDGAGSKATKNAEPHAAATAARLGGAWRGDRGKREHTCGGDSGHRCLHVPTSFRNDRVAIVRFYPGFLKPRLSIHAPVRDISDAPKPPCVPSAAQIPTQRPESGQPYFNQPSQFVRNLLNAV